MWMQNYFLQRHKWANDIMNTKKHSTQVSDEVAKYFWDCGCNKKNVEKFKGHECDFIS